MLLIWTSIVYFPGSARVLSQVQLGYCTRVNLRMVPEENTSPSKNSLKVLWLVHLLATSKGMGSIPTENNFILFHQSFMRYLHNHNISILLLYLIIN